jgi:hypothetical protein
VRGTSPLAVDDFMVVVRIGCISGMHWGNRWPSGTFYCCCSW